MVPRARGMVLAGCGEPANGVADQIGVWRPSRPAVTEPSVPTEGLPPIPAQISGRADGGPPGARRPAPNERGKSLPAHCSEGLKFGGDWEGEAPSEPGKTGLGRSLALPNVPLF